MRFNIVHMLFVIVNLLNTIFSGLFKNEMLLKFKTTLCKYMKNAAEVVVDSLSKYWCIVIWCRYCQDSISLVALEKTSHIVSYECCYYTRSRFPYIFNSLIRLNCIGLI